MYFQRFRGEVGCPALRRTAWLTAQTSSFPVQASHRVSQNSHRSLVKHPAAVFIETPRTRAHGGNKARPQRNGAGCPMEWPHRVQTSGTGAPQDEPRLRASLTGATPRPRTDPASEPDAFPNMARSRRTRPFLDASCPVRSLCVGTSLRESRNTSQGVLENVTGSLGNVTLLPILSQGVRSWPDNMPRTVSL